MTTRTTRACALMASVAMFATQALADGCMKPEEKAALKVATLQQELMVAALACGDVSAYNAFVKANRAELIREDRDLQSFYSRLYKKEGDAQYQTVKTRLANHFSLSSLHNGDSFCRHANALFAGLHRDRPLATQVSWISIDDTREACEAPVVETILGASASVPARFAKKAKPAVAPSQEVADADEHAVGKAATAERAYRARSQRQYYPPPPRYYPPPGYYYPPPGYYDGYGW